MPSHQVISQARLAMDGSRPKLRTRCACDSPVSMRALKKIWDEIDSDGDGRISAPEFRTWIQTGNATLGGMSSSIFSTLDKTRQGHLTFNVRPPNLPDFPELFFPKHLCSPQTETLGL